MSSPSSSSSYFTSLGLGYSITVALGFLVLLSSVTLVSYICFCRRQSRRSSPFPRTRSTSDGIILPRIFFVAETDQDAELEIGGNRGAVGLTQAVINSYPKFSFEKDTTRPVGSDTTTCSICLCDYKESEMLRIMPECRHCFHLICLDVWLKFNGSCPVCRNSPFPTPLSEVVPLSQYDEDGGRWQ
ncbi:hypothetical protein SAY86_001417 [Trapa natans]|uniref:RING-type domain-containing protein n=1 Tax=Trapa natans TaxID=22666 RepID=A0AAN7MCN5_TRANT|nr:hypothetical protein SAY86_001417 [Trapa natans]